ncbi:MAG: nuclear transport factor 2 family protein [Chthoniobacteraceae bacterium]
MKHLLAALLLVPFFAFAEERPEVALRAADDGRIAAMKSPDREMLSAVFSDDLRYVHSNGVVDDKASFMDILISGKTKYVGYDHVERAFTFPTADIALMAGRARIQAETAGGKMDSILSYLAVWRLEKGRWRFLAWQSCRLPPAGGK